VPVRVRREWQGGHEDAPEEVVALLLDQEGALAHFLEHAATVRRILELGERFRSAEDGLRLCGLDLHEVGEDGLALVALQICADGEHLEEVRILGTRVFAEQEPFPPRPRDPVLSIPRSGPQPTPLAISRAMRRADEESLRTMLLAFDEELPAATLALLVHHPVAVVRSLAVVLRRYARPSLSSIGGLLFVEARDEEVLEWLLGEGVPIDAPHPRGGTALDHVTDPDRRAWLQAAGAVTGSGDRPSDGGGHERHPKGVRRRPVGSSS
jgi:hypothetical protein